MRLLIGYVVILLAYAIIKICLFLPMTVATGVIVAYGNSFLDFGGRPKAYNSVYDPYPIISFKEPKTDTFVTARDDRQGAFNADYKEGDVIQVCFYPNHPEKARVYSFGAYWFTIPVMLFLGFLCLVWTCVIGFIQINKEYYPNG